MKRTLTSLLLLCLAGCALGPDYKRPGVSVPKGYRVPDPQPPSSDAASLADTPWFEVFQDEQLQRLIREALVNNYDLRDAVARVDAARAVVGITRSNQFPNAGASGSVNFNRLSRTGATNIPSTVLPDQNRTYGSAALNLLSFEVDLWGKWRRASEAARAELLGAEENRKTVATVLVSDLATAYLTLCELDYALEISQRTLKTREASLELVKTRQGGGVATMLDLRQAEQLVETAAQSIPVLQQQIEQTENRISLLVARNPDTVVRGRGFNQQTLPPEVPAGLPSSLLERRPDIRAAEQLLVSANARIGVAKAAYFPQLTLTGFLGGQSTQLTSLFSGPGAAWSLVPQLSQPIFTAGRLKGNVKLAEAQRQGALIHYEKTIQVAFTEVSDALIAHRRMRESRERQQALVNALQDRTRLAYVRYRGGVDTQLNALDADRDLFQAELALANIRLGEMLTVVDLYKALGGGWK